MKYALGYKKGMTQVYVEDRAVPVTVVEVPENSVYSVKDENGSSLVEIGTGVKKRPNKAEMGKYKDGKNIPKVSFFVRIKSDEQPKVGDKYSVDDLLSTGDQITVTGTTKSKGFAGVVKRWGFKGGQRTHGQTDRERAPGSIGAGTDPGRVFKGKKMGGRMGGKTKTLIRRKVVDVGDNFVLIHGPLPGSPGSLLKIKIVKKDEG